MEIDTTSETEPIQSGHGRTSDMTVNNFKKSDVIRKLNQTLLDNQLNEAFYWMFELHISGCIRKIWEMVFTVVAKNINISNPTLPLWIYLRYMRYCSLMEELKYKHNPRDEAKTATNPDIRQILVEVIYVVSQSSKNKLLSAIKPPKINPKEDFSEENRLKRMIDDPLIKSDIEKIPNDITEDEDVKLVLREIGKQLSQKISKIEDAIYWYYWLEKLLKTKSVPFPEMQLWKVVSLRANKINPDKSIENQLRALYQMSFAFKERKRIPISQIEMSKLNFITCRTASVFLFSAFLFVKYTVHFEVPMIKDIIQFNKLHLVSHRIYHGDEIFKEPVNENPTISIKTKKMKQMQPLKLKRGEAEKQQQRISQKIDFLNKVDIISSREKEPK